MSRNGESNEQSKTALEDLTLGDLRLIDQLHQRDLRATQGFATLIARLSVRVGCSPELIQVVLR